MIDLAPYQDLKIAPRAVFDRLPTHAERPRFMVPDAAAGWRPVTWGELAAQIRETAQALAAWGFAPGDRAAVYAPNRVEWLAAALAIQAAGGVMVPIYPSSTAEQVGYVVAHSDARVVFVAERALLGRLAAAQQVPQAGGGALERVVLLDDGVDRSVASELCVPIVGWAETLATGREAGAKDPGGFERRMGAVALEQPGLMLYTSGTSGPPKGVPLTHRNIGVNGRDWLECNAPLVDEGATDLLWLPMSHIFGFGEACLGNTLGWTSWLVDPLTVVQRLPEVRPDVFMSVPSLWEKLAMAALAEPDPARRGDRLREVTGGRLRFCLSGGAGLKREVKELFHAHGILLIEGYGLTEASPTITLNRPEAFRFDSVGRPLPSVEVRLADDGEILARGPSIFAGYHKDAAATAEALTADGWLKTGDVGRFTDDGFLQIVDRKKDILVLANGKNVPPVNVEQRFADDPFVAHAVVYGDGQRYLVAGLWPNVAAIDSALTARGVAPEARGAAMQALLSERVAAVNAQLASYESIKRFAIMDPPLTIESGFLTPTLKVKRKRVYEAFRDRFAALYESGGER